MMVVGANLRVEAAEDFVVYVFHNNSSDVPVNSAQQTVENGQQCSVVLGAVPVSTGDYFFARIYAKTALTIDAGTSSTNFWGCVITGGGAAFTQTIAVSDETTDLATGTAKITLRMPAGVTLSEVRASVNTAPVGSTLIVDINEGGTSILSTKLSIDASEKTSKTAATAAVISDAALADDAEITIDIDQIWSSTAGAGLKVTLVGVYT